MNDSVLDAILSCPRVKNYSVDGLIQLKNIVFFWALFSIGF